MTWILNSKIRFIMVFQSLDMLVTNGKNTAYELQPAAPILTGHSQRIKIYSFEKCYGGIAQKVYIEENMNYDITIILRASVEIKFIDVGIYDRNGDPIESKRLNIMSHDWSEYKCILNNTGKNRIAEFRITTNTTLWYLAFQHGYY